MKVLGPIWRIRSFVEETAGNNRVTEFTVRMIAEYGTRFLLEKTEDGYSRDIQGTKVEMKKPVHFFDLITHSPVKGYLKRVNLEEVDLLIDGGAFPGEFAILAAKNGTEVIAMEPDPENAEMMRENIRMNKVEDKIEVVEKGLWSEKNEIEFHKDTCLGVGSRVEDGSDLEVSMDTLDNIVSKYGIPDLVKLDVEGAEIEALKGGKSTLSNQKPEIVVATYHRTDNNRKTVKPVEKILKNYGYNTVTEYPKHLTTYASKADIQ